MNVQKTILEDFKQLTLYQRRAIANQEIRIPSPNLPYNLLVVYLRPS